MPLWLLFFTLALFSLKDDSPTMDEQNHLARGAALVRTGDPRLSVEHPPVANGLSGLMLLLLPDLRLPTDHPSWEQTDGWYLFADQFLWVYNQDVPRIVFLGRLAMVFLTMGLSLVGYHLAKRLWGGPAGILALAFLLFDPNIIAHGRYVTTDVAGATFLLLALLLLHRLWSAPGWSWPRLLWASLGLALAWGSKLSNLAFVPILGLLAILPLYRGRAGRNLLAYGLAGLLSIPILWLFFALEWGPFRFAGDVPWLLSLNQFSGPMPTFWQGVERMLLLGSDSGRTSFLLGETKTGGFLLYFPIAFMVKTPLLTIVALLVAAVWLGRRPGSRPATVFLLVPLLLFFGLMLTNSLNIGYRHLLPMLPLAYVLIAGLAGRRVADGGAVAPAGLNLAVYLLPFTLTVALLSVSLAIYPHYLSYFNVIGGGPANGYNILIDSNVDWGQDLLRLQDWMAENEVDSVKLGWFGSARPEYYGINYEPLPGLPHHLNLFWDPPFDPQNPAPGIYAISVSILWEIPLQEKGLFAWFRAREPDARIGYSIFIYEVPEP
ncbi:MAG: glycosyltransferase family 39 protein [Anaerolineales bacterium]|nr:glycosyltransferase family 39 protein [Anaerolineales bacterium]